MFKILGQLLYFCFNIRMQLEGRFWRRQVLYLSPYPLSVPVYTLAGADLSMWENL